MKNTIECIDEKGYCCGCGTCVSVCPKDAIDIYEDVKRGIYRPKINFDLCIDCGVCIRSCPQRNVEERVAGDLNSFLGKILSSYQGYAKNLDIRYQSSSGGLITALSIYLLRKKVVNGVINSGNDPSNPCRFKGVICRTEEEVLQSKGSKYCPVAINCILKEILNEKSDSKYAYVGLPCHIDGLRKVMEFSPALEEKIPFVFGLICSHTPTFNGTKFILTKHKVSKDKIKFMRYRGDGWPGMMHVQNGDNIIKISSKDYWGKYFGNYMFSAKFCLLCNDLYARNCDISFGDAWLKRFSDDTKGTSIAITRTKKGADLIQSAIKDKIILCGNLGRKEIIRSQLGCLIIKWFAFNHRARLLGVQKIKSNNEKIQQRVLNYIIVVNYLFSKTNVFCSFMMIAFFEKIYFKMVSKLKNLTINSISKKGNFVEVPK